MKISKPPDPDHSLSKLDYMTDRLPPLSDFIATKLGRTVEYAMDSGVCFGIGALNQDDVAVQKSFISQGAKFPHHDHKEVEILAVFKGEIQVSTNSCDKTLGVGDVIKISPEEEHSVNALSDAWIIGITIPRSEGYPAVP